MNEPHNYTIEAHVSKGMLSRIGWDDPLPNELYKELCCIIADMNKVSSIEMPRC